MTPEQKTDWIDQSIKKAGVVIVRHGDGRLAGTLYTIGMYQVFGAAEIILPPIPEDVAVRIGRTTKELILEFFMARQYGRLPRGIVPGLRFLLPSDAGEFDRSFFAYSVPENLRPLVHLPEAVEYYGRHDISAWQLFWPSVDGLFPWEIGCDKYIKTAQVLRDP